MSKLQNIGDLFTPEGKKKLRKRQLLVFKKDGKRKISYRITSLVGGVWVRKVETITGEELNSHYGHLIDATEDTIKIYGAPFCQECQVVVGDEK